MAEDVNESETDFSEETEIDTNDRNDSTDAIDKLTPEEQDKLKDEALKIKIRANESYKSGEYTESIKEYTNALDRLGSRFKKDRSIMFANRAAAKLMLDQKTAAVIGKSLKR